MIIKCFKCLQKLIPHVPPTAPELPLLLARGGERLRQVRARVHRGVHITRPPREHQDLGLQASEKGE